MQQVTNIIFAIPSTVWIALLCVVLFYIWGTWPHRQLKRLGIPGPKATPFFGNLPELNKKGIINFNADLLEKYGKVVSFYTGRYPCVIVADPEMIKQIMVKDFSAFTNRSRLLPADKLTESMVIRARDEKWKFLRTVLSPNFSSKKMRAMVPLIHSALLNLDKNCEAKSKSGEDVDINALFGGYTMDVIASTSFGIDVDSQNNPSSAFVKNARALVRTNRLQGLFQLFYICNPLARITLPLLFKIIGRTRKFFADFCWLILADRRKNNDEERKDLLQMMIDTEQNEKVSKETNGAINDDDNELKNTGLLKRKMTDQEIVAQCIIFFIAGYETTASTLSFMAHSLALNPDIQKKLHQEIKGIIGDEAPDYDNIQKLTYLDQCMSETLRKYPIATRVMRESSRDITIKNWPIPKQTDVIIPIYNIHHNPEYWPEPEKFDPDRFSPEAKEKQIPFTYLPFGGGPRICIGLRLAHLELKMAMVQILRKFQFVPCEKTEDPIEIGNFTLLTPKNGITLKIKKLQA